MKTLRRGGDEASLGAYVITLPSRLFQEASAAAGRGASTQACVVLVTSTCIHTHPASCCFLPHSHRCDGGGVPLPGGAADSAGPHHPHGGGGAPPRRPRSARHRRHHARQRRAQRAAVEAARRDGLAVDLAEVAFPGRSSACRRGWRTWTSWRTPTPACTCPCRGPSGPWRRRSSGSSGRCLAARTASSPTTATRGRRPSATASASLASSCTARRRTSSSPPTT